MMRRIILSTIFLCLLSRNVGGVPQSAGNSPVTGAAALNATGVRKNNAGRKQNLFRGKVTMTEINGQPLGDQRPEAGVQPSSDRVVWLEPYAEAQAQGEVSGLILREGEVYLVQLVVQRVYDGGWWVIGSSQVEPAGRNAAWRWVVRDARLPKPDYGKGFYLYAILIPQGRELPEGIIDDETARRYALAYTEKVQCRIRCGGYIEITRIKDITGKMVDPADVIGEPIEVGWTPEIKGLADLSDGSFIHLVIHPVTGEDKWVMERKGGIPVNRNWSETAYIGRIGQDAGDLFRLQAIVSKKFLDHRAYSPEEWNNLKGDICAVSGEIMVRRRVGRMDLIIQKIDETEVSGIEPIRTDFEFRVTGGIEDNQDQNRLRSDEKVYLLYRSVVSPDQAVTTDDQMKINEQQWRVGAVATVLPDGFSWRATSMRLRQAGQYKLIAIAARTKLDLETLLAPQNWYDFAVSRPPTVTRLSRVITINVATAPSDASATADSAYIWFWIACGLGGGMVLLLGLLLFSRRTHRRELSRLS